MRDATCDMVEMVDGLQEWTLCLERKRNDGNPEKKRLICRIVIQKQCIGWEKGGDWSLAMIGML
jgi:hypothetical protein